MKNDIGCRSVPCDDGLMERPRYFARQLITPDDMTLEQDYFRNRMRRHNRLLHGWGVVCGAKVCPVIKANGNGSSEPWKVVVKSGYILGPYGDEILIDCDRCLDLRTRCITGVTGEVCGETVDPWCSDVYVERPPAGGSLFVAVKYKQVTARPVRVQPVGCGCDDTQCEYSRWRDGYEICVLDKCPDSHTSSPPKFEDLVKGPLPECCECPPDPWVVLAEVQVDENGRIKMINNCSCRRQVISFGCFWWACEAKQVRVTGVDKPKLLHDARDVDVKITGENFLPNATVSLGTGLKAEVTSVQTDGKAISVKVTVTDAAAAAGEHMVVVVNTDCTTGAWAEKMTVAPAPTRVTPKRGRGATE